MINFRLKKHLYNFYCKNLNVRVNKKCLPLRGAYGMDISKQKLNMYENVPQPIRYDGIFLLS